MLVFLFFSNLEAFSICHSCPIHSNPRPSLSLVELRSREPGRGLVDELDFSLGSVVLGAGRINYLPAGISASGDDGNTADLEDCEEKLAFHFREKQRIGIEYVAVPGGTYTSSRLSLVSIVVWLLLGVELLGILQNCRALHCLASPSICVVSREGCGRAKPVSDSLKT